ncbi:hypothetical protein [Microbulbifer variabilis]|uniref:hypothetical protein n=1 Tax=Microbulbifer variabilis TaxID=266805 RepID=UPI00038280BF|nr:hypothetical protein [Microbulbifer variabilis]
MVHVKSGTDPLSKKGGDGPFPIKGGKSGQSITQSGNKSEQHKLIDFTKFKVIKGHSGDYVLTVWGKNDPDIIPSLEPHIYVVNPDYYEIEVIGVPSGDVPSKNV